MSNDDTKCECGKNVTCQCATPFWNPAYGGCNCECHTNPNVLHVTACCGIQSESLFNQDVFNFDSVKLDEEKSDESD